MSSGQKSNHIAYSLGIAIVAIAAFAGGNAVHNHGVTQEGRQMAKKLGTDPKTASRVLGIAERTGSVGCSKGDIDEIERLLEHPAIGVRDFAYVALSECRYNQDARVPVLLDKMESEVPELRGGYLSSVRRTGDPRWRSLAEKWLASGDESRVRVARKALKRYAHE